MKAEKVYEIYQSMRDERGSMDALWAECIRFCFPQEKQQYSPDSQDTTIAGKRRANPVCSYPVVYALRLASALHAAAFPANDDWFALTFLGYDMTDARNAAAKQWCREMSDLTHAKIRQGTNFYQASHAMMHGLAVLGTSCFETYWKNGGLRFRYIPIHKNVFVSQNSEQEVDMVAIKHDWTARQAIQEYGDKVSDEIKQEAQDCATPGRTFAFVQLIYPKKAFSEKYDSSKLGAGGKPYGDVTIEVETMKVVREDGYAMFPFSVPRFLVVSDDLYGRSPAMNAMNDIKAANRLRKNMLDASERAIKPPIFIDGMLSKASLEPGVVNRVNGFDNGKVWAYPMPVNFPVGENLKEEIKEDIKQAFYIDVFQAIEQQSRMTATEITERVRQKTEALSSIIVRLQQEFASRVILQCVNLLIEHREAPPIPDEFVGKQLKIGYISTLDSMIRQGKAAKTMNLFSQLNLVGQTIVQNPDYANLFNVDAISYLLADANTLPAEIFRDADEVERMRAEQAQAQQTMNQVNIAQMQAKAGADAGKANLLNTQAQEAQMRM